MFELNVTALIILIYFLYRVRKTNKRTAALLEHIHVNFLKLKELEERKYGHMLPSATGRNMKI